MAERTWTESPMRSGANVVWWLRLRPAWHQTLGFRLAVPTASRVVLCQFPHLPVSPSVHPGHGAGSRCPLQESSGVDRPRGCEVKVPGQRVLLVGHDGLHVGNPGCSNAPGFLRSKCVSGRLHGRTV